MKQCPNGHSVSDEAKFCPTCGAEVIDNALKFCTKCGNERIGSEKYCTKCGAPFDLSEGVMITSNKDNKSTKTKKRGIISFMLIFILLLGGCYYWYNNKITKQEKLIPIEVVLEMCKNNDMDFIIQGLEAYGYKYFTQREGTMYYTKNVLLREVELYNGDVRFEAVKQQGSSASITDNNGSLRFLMSIYTKEDFKVWEKQLQDLGYEPKSYDSPFVEEDGWEALGAHGYLFKQFVDKNENRIEFIDYDGYTVYDYEFN